jgi:hypothetical protein
MKIFHSKQSYLKQAPNPDHKPAPNLLEGITLLLKFIIIQRHKEVEVILKFPTAKCHILYKIFVINQFSNDMNFENV